LFCVRIRHTQKSMEWLLRWPNDCSMREITSRCVSLRWYLCIGLAPRASAPWQWLSWSLQRAWKRDECQSGRNTPGTGLSDIPKPSRNFTRSSASHYTTTKACIAQAREITQHQFRAGLSWVRVSCRAASAAWPVLLVAWPGHSHSAKRRWCPRRRAVPPHADRYAACAAPE